MPFNPGGIFTLIASYLAQPGTTIRTEQHNPVFEDVAAALSQVLIRDGRAPMTGALNMNGFPINNIQAGSSPSSVATLAQAMPIGAVIDFAGSTAPAGWLLCFGQAISRTTYAALFAAIGTSFGAGDGSTTFNLPDCRGRVVAGKDNMGGTGAGRLRPDRSGITGTTLGAAGGEEMHQLTQAQLPITTLTFTGTQGEVAITQGNNTLLSGTALSNQLQAGDSGIVGAVNLAIGKSLSGFFTPSGTISTFGSNVAHNNVQPTIVLNKIIRVSYDG